jgi:hypothetical protein
MQNQTRTTKELLILLRDYIINGGLNGGLCATISNMTYQSHPYGITDCEWKVLKSYVDKNKPKFPSRYWLSEIRNRPFYWKRFDSKPRINWLNSQIKKQR